MVAIRFPHTLHLCKLARHRHHRPLLGVFPSSCRELLSPAPQITIFSKRPQNVMRALNWHKKSLCRTAELDRRV